MSSDSKRLDLASANQENPTKKRGFTPPADADIVTVDHDFIEIDFTTDYYGSGNGRTRLERSLLSIRDHAVRYLTGKWEPSWMKVAPGIETCSKGSATTSGAQQRVTGKSVRVQQAACPVYIHYRQSYEHMDYDSSGESSSYDKWMCVQAVGEASKSFEIKANRKKLPGFLSSVLKIFQRN